MSRRCCRCFRFFGPWPVGSSAGLRCDRFTLASAACGCDLLHAARFQPAQDATAAIGSQASYRLGILRRQVSLGPLPVGRWPVASVGSVSLLAVHALRSYPFLRTRSPL